MRAQIDRPTLLWRGFVLVGVGSLAVLSTSDAAWQWWEDNVSDQVPRTAVRGVLGGTVAVHLVEAAVAGRAARRAGLPHPGAWARTTLIYGFPELRRLRRAARGDVTEIASGTSLVVTG